MSESDRIFVEQLRLVAMSSERLRKCIYDHNRAFAQRSIWQRDRLLKIGELGRYDQELKEAWERFFLPVGEDDTADEAEVLRLARERFAELDRSDLAPIRRDVRQGFVARGSLHVIADRLEIVLLSAGVGGLILCSSVYASILARRLPRASRLARARRSQSDRMILRSAQSLDSIP